MCRVLRACAAEDLRPHDCDDDGTGVRPLLAPVDEESAPVEDGEGAG